MKISFGESLRNARTEKGLSQQQLAEKLNVDRSTVASWETNRRTPGFGTVTQISKLLEMDTSALLQTGDSADKPIVIMVDDERIILSGGIPILREVMPNAEVVGFTRPSEAIRFALTHRIAIAFLDIELRSGTGLELCRRLLEINKRTNVVYLTAYSDYSFDAWETGACGFLLKPLTAEKVEKQLTLLRFPVKGLNLI